MLQLILASLFFVGIHIVVSGTRLRALLVARLGERPYMGLFSLLSLAGLAWQIWAYGRAPYVGLWGQVSDARWIALVLVLIAFLLVVVGLTSPNPTAVGGEQLISRGDAARGIFRITRHPFLMGVGLWALVHLVYNGDLASLIFFGSFLVLAVLGPPSIDRKLRDALGESWQKFAAQTSVIPFAAILKGRSRLALGEIGWWRPVIAVLAYAVILHSHKWLFGVSPMPM
jgi:uncharacterized membrane protein